MCKATDSLLSTGSHSNASMRESAGALSHSTAEATSQSTISVFNPHNQEVNPAQIRSIDKLLQT